MPLLMRAASGLTALDLPHAGMLVSSLCLIGMALVGVRYRQATRNAQRPSTWLVLCAAMPFGLYFDTGYSESAYGVLSLATLLGLARRSPLAASLPSALLSAARPTGVWLAPAIGLASLGRARHAPSAAALLLALLPGLIAALGLLAWMFYLAIAAGDPIAFVHAEAGWGRHPANPVATLARSLSYLLPRRHHLQEGWQGAWALIGLAVSSWLAWSRRWTEACFLGVTVVLALSTGNGASMCRFVGASPVFLLALADLIDRAGRPARIAVLIACAGLQALFDLLWIDGWHWLV